MKLKQLVLLFVFGLTFFTISCDSLSSVFNYTTETTNDSQSVVSVDTSVSDYLCDLSSDDLASYLESLDNTDPVIAASLVIPSVVELTVNFEFSYTATYKTPWGVSSQTVADSATSEATGFFINEEGYIVTNAHVVSLTDYEDYPDFDYSSRTVSFSFADSNAVYTATIINYDVELDLAVLKSDTVFADQSYLTFFGIDASSNINLYYGEDVIAVGNANGYGISVTSGIVSAPLRYFEDGYSVIQAVQTDAAINSGNSGGPLANLYGVVVGINSFKIVTSTSESLGYAIPANVVMDYLDGLDIPYHVTTERAYH